MTRSVRVYFSNAFLPIRTRSFCCYAKMDSKYCSRCTQKRLLSSFLSDAFNPGSKVLATYNICRASKSRYQKRKALQPLDPNIQAKRRVPQPTKALTRPEATIPPPNPPEARPETPIPIPTPPPIQPQAPGFLPADQWASIQSFNRAMEDMKMEFYSRCKERWFYMDLKSDVYHRCFNRDKGNKTPFLMYRLQVSTGHSRYRLQATGYRPQVIGYRISQATGQYRL